MKNKKYIKLATKGVEEYDLGFCKLGIINLPTSKRIFINLNRAKKPYTTLDTQTVYCSIENNDKKYTSVSVDRQNKQVTGVAVFWDT